MSVTYVSIKWCQNCGTRLPPPDTHTHEKRRKKYLFLITKEAQDLWTDPHCLTNEILKSSNSKLLVQTLFLHNRIEPPHDKTNKMNVCPAKTQISLGIRPVWSESSLCAQWVAKDPSFLHADSKDSDQTGRMPRLIWVFAGFVMSRLKCKRTFHLSMCDINIHASFLHSKVIPYILIWFEIFMLVYLCVVCTYSAMGCLLWNEQQHDKTSNDLCTQRRLWLIRVFAVRMQLWVLTVETDQTGQIPRLIWVFIGRTDRWFCHAVAQSRVHW